MCCNVLVVGRAYSSWLRPIEGPKHHLAPRWVSFPQVMGVSAALGLSPDFRGGGYGGAFSVEVGHAVAVLS